MVIKFLSKLNGGRVKQSKYREFGLANIRKKRESIFDKKTSLIKKNINKVWMSHADQVSKLPKNFNVIASSQNSKFAIIENKKKIFMVSNFIPKLPIQKMGKN